MDLVNLRNLVVVIMWIHFFIGLFALVWIFVIAPLIVLSSAIVEMVSKKKQKIDIEKYIGKSIKFTFIVLIVLFVLGIFLRELEVKYYITAPLDF